jgi:hypothetical protein
VFCCQHVCEETTRSDSGVVAFYHTIETIVWIVSGNSVWKEVGAERAALAASKRAGPVSTPSVYTKVFCSSKFEGSGVYSSLQVDSVVPDRNSLLEAFCIPVSLISQREVRTRPGAHAVIRHSDMDQCP